MRLIFRNLLLPQIKLSDSQKEKLDEEIRVFYLDERMMDNVEADYYALYKNE